MSEKKSSRILRSRWIVPVHQDPIPNGWVELFGETIVGIGGGSPPGTAIDLGDVAVLPGLINAHTHLEFSQCASPVGHPGIAFDAWIEEVIRTRGDTNLKSKNDAIVSGLRESTDAGVRLIGDIATPPCDYPLGSSSLEQNAHAAEANLQGSVPVQSYPEVISFAEVLGLTPERSADRFEALQAHQQNVPSAAVSPHAPYSTSNEVVGQCVKWAATHSRTLAMHIAESPAERELLASGTGPLADMLRKWGLYREDCFPHSDQPILDLIDVLSKAPRGLIVHGNDLRDNEIERLAGHDHVSVVMCPRTHHYFSFARHPLAKLLASGIRVALGTDSRASNPDLHLWNEVRFLLNRRMDIDPATVIEMATRSGAEALGRNDLGSLAIGTMPGLNIVPTLASGTAELFRDFAQSKIRPLALASLSR